MDYKTFERCFEALCLSFDIDFEKKKNRMEHYFDSKLGEISEHAFLEVIKKAKTELQPKQGYLPPIRDLKNLYFDININRPRPEKLDDRENFYHAICPICDNTGRVSLLKDGYRYGGFCCTCIIGQNKQANTELGRKMGCYKNALLRGYTMENEDDDEIDPVKLEKFKKRIEKMKQKIAIEAVPF